MKRGFSRLTLEEFFTLILHYTMEANGKMNDDVWKGTLPNHRQ